MAAAALGLDTLPHARVRDSALLDPKPDIRRFLTSLVRDPLKHARVRDGSSTKQHNKA